MKIIESNQEYITSGYGWRPELGDFHTGIDICRWHDGYCDFDYICAKEKGTVCNVRTDCQGFEGGGSYGNFVHIDHGNGYSTLYAHLAPGTITVGIGQSVEEGQIIGYMGATGTVYGGHLHFEVRIWNEHTDPTPYFNGQRMIQEIKLPEPVERNEEVNQLSVNCDDTMRIRTGHYLASECIGAARTGYYDILETFEEDGYIWCRVGEKRYIAVVEPYSNILYKKEEPKEEQKEEPKEEPDKKDENDGKKEEKEEPKTEESKFIKFIKWLINIIVSCFRKD